MAYSEFGPARRSRRRRNVVVLISFLLIIGVLALAVRYRTERRESIDYLSVAEEVAVQHGELAERLGTLFQGLGQEDRPAVVQRLETMAREARAGRRQLEAATPTRAVAEVGGLMAVAVAAWDDALGAMDDAIVAVLDGEEGELTGDEALREAFDLLRLGDRAYERALEEVARVDPELVPMAFPAVSYTGEQYAALYDATIIADRLRRLGTLSEVRDVAIVAATVPEPVSEGVGGIWTVPASDTFALEVTVSNTGNVAAELVKVVVVLQRAGSGDSIAPVGQVIPAIEPDASETLLFEDLGVEPGAVYTISAVASFEDGTEDATDDNTWSLMFERNGE